jgi:CHASE3 domain sensor protein
MYRVCVDPTTREDIAAATAVHRDLGPGYTDAVSEALVDRIGAEIDKRVDARLAQRDAGAAATFAAPAAPPAPAARPAWVPVAIAASSLGCGVGATALVLFATASNINGRLHNSVSGPQIVLVALIWAVIAVVNVAYARRQS